ncbi:MAG: glycosyltransferase family 2 protein [Cyclobacteriaceae bacterium]|nr:glycosyltransferase family 2 protein [Cyclobacteriaceae bacterium]
MIVIVPMAGRGSRYATQGYETPKPLIEVAGKPMVLWALESLKGITVSKYIIVALKEHEEHFGIQKLITNHVSEKVEFVWLEQVTEGQLCTVLAAKELLDVNEDVLIASSDTLVHGNLGEDLANNNRDGIISVANLPGEQWSFARTDKSGKVVEVAEKKRISDHASTGLYYFRNASVLIEHGERMINNQEKTRGEYYVIPVYQKMIEAGYSIGISKATAMWDMGTPEAKANFEKYLASQ